MVKSGLTLLSGNAAASLFLLMRNLSVAVLIPVADYGVAATFAIAMAVVEMATDLGLQQQIVQSDKGEDSRFQAALQGFQVLRGVIAGAVLFACAGPLAAFMGVGEMAWAYQVLALVPVLNGFQHMDIHRLNRAMVFGPLVLSKTLPAVLSLALVWPLAMWLGDARVMLWAIMAQVGATLLVSHLVARRAYALVFDPGVMRAGLAFGLPLLLNGALLFAVFQGDKIIVGRVLGMEALALIAMGFTLTLTPTLVLARSVQNYFLPQLSRAREDFARLAQVTLEVTLFVSLTLLVLVGVLGPWLIALVLGAKYAALGDLLIWFALMQALYMTKVGHSVVALSQGRTTLALWSNLARVALLPLVWWVAVQGGDLRHLIWIGIVGEAAGYGIGVILLRRTCAVPILWGPQIAVVLVILASTLAAVIAPQEGLPVVLIAGLLAASFTFRTMRAHLRTGAQENRV